MIIENTPESVREAKVLLGLPIDTRVGFVRRSLNGGPVELYPMIQVGDRIWTVGDEVLPV